MSRLNFVKNLAYPRLRVLLDIGMRDTAGTGHALFMINFLAARPEWRDGDPRVAQLSTVE